MIITCNQCHTRFKVDNAKIKSTGTRVRCSNCQSVFTVFLPEAEDGAQKPIPMPRRGGEQQKGPGNGSYSSDGAEQGLLQGARQMPAKPIVPASPDVLVAPDLLAKDGEPDPRQSGTYVLEGGQGGAEPYGEAAYQNPAVDRDLGLDSDPAQQAPVPQPDPALQYPPQQNEYSLFDPERMAEKDTVVPRDPIVPRKPGVGAKKLVLLICAILCAVFVCALLLIINKPSAVATRALQDGTTGEGSGEEGTQRGPLENLEPNPNTIDKLTFVENETSHYIRSNLTSGKLLIITGRITNEYPDKRSFIRVRGLLKNPEGTVEAERQSYAGNYLSETELTSLPINEILSRLAIKGGQNGLNIGVEPKNSISFMLVFDKIPDDLTSYEYVVDVVSSVSAGPATPPVSPQTPDT
ncbi:MAG: zinc-ribbon domain-containing protein [Deltaproteobacteria bacterium]|jgi:predicted Zn finger-like uncharacterized protein|nr:zinc-ribbon domain-containing protein [Deltaproteobacteria bacterium]